MPAIYEIKSSDMKQANRNRKIVLNLVEYFAFDGFRKSKVQKTANNSTPSCLHKAAITVKKAVRKTLFTEWK